MTHTTDETRMSAETSTTTTACDLAETIANLQRQVNEALVCADVETPERLGALTAKRSGGMESGGLVLLAADNTITRADPAARVWLAELHDSSRDDLAPPVVAAVASRARSTDDPDATPDVVARARVRTASGTWLFVRGSRLGHDADAETAVVLEPARPHELAPLIAAAYGLTNRERAVTQLVAQGLSTDAMASRLHISPWTVQDHLKAIFEKVGAGTRGELVARIFFGHDAPRLSEAAPLGVDGWFALPDPEDETPAEARR